MDMVALVVGLFAGGAVGATIVFALSRKAQAELVTLTAERDGLRTEKQALDTELITQRAKVGELGVALAKAESAEASVKAMVDTIRQERDQAQTNLESLRRVLEEVRVSAATASARADEALASRDVTIQNLRETIEKTHEQMEKTFGETSTKALQEATTKFLELANTQFKDEQYRASKRSEDEQKAIQKLLEPVQKELDSLEKLTRETDEKRSETFGQLRGQIESLSKNSESLANALKRPSVRGSWGEGQLLAILESSGMVQGKNFVVQDQTDAEGRILRTDVVILLPRGRKIVIDSKAPLDRYLAAMDSVTEDDKVRLCVEHARAVRNHVRDLSKKEYWSRYEGSPEYVILFLPYEAAYQIACEHDRSLLDDAHRARIVIANPMTLMNLVHLATYVLNEERLQENAEAVRQHARQLAERLTKVLEIMSKHGRHLRMAAESYNDIVGSVQGRLVPAANRMRELGAGTEKAMEAPETVDVAIRPLAVPEAPASPVSALPGLD